MHSQAFASRVSGVNNPCQQSFPIIKAFPNYDIRSARKYGFPFNRFSSARRDTFRRDNEDVVGDIGYFP